MICPKHAYAHRKGDFCPNSTTPQHPILARSEARRARRIEKVAENAVLPTAPFMPQASQEPQGAALRPHPRRPAIRTPVRARKTGKPRRQKLPSITKLRKRVWDALSLYVRDRDALVNDGLCLICSSRPIELAYHLIPASESAVMKFDPEAVVGGCSYCNGCELHARASYALKHVELFGLERMNALRAKMEKAKRMKSLGDAVQYRRPDYEAMLTDFTEKRAALRATSRGAGSV